ncbi:hypothetical protein LTR02_016018 [Friedmanniomyces endolithicus]|uniref:Ubiquitin carboxyl-terminal hydrolase n=1 Tax=Friedmanniomyces endolithicus TaxID=329885 RepID=A0A4U0VIJ6_9PEZI|nr:hypothetical protein LTS09_006333 [Friedmanniomyces endolithicus]KAK0343406.1 hypothetical protein LTR94_018491 [Friedmanniomyces endolithicus]KAK0774530.1 hypothetical protein LTR38_016198 [Friedmanniomyces endolithicus]KAK0779571.1 hypothetical protein LTR75_015308 [Friedmanniomyces endolithicus]KAK0794910.1 hypothetical protein LTR59_007616 [Friedmanniomyces endolithicus]
MAFFGKFKPGSTPSQSAGAAQGAKKDHPPAPTHLEKHLVGVTGPIRPDGSDKFFGFENYGSTCYCNSIIQCLYYSAPFRENVLNFPSQPFLEALAEEVANTPPNARAKPMGRSPSLTPYPNPNSPARKVTQPTSPNATTKPEESKDAPESRKKLALAAGPVLEMVSGDSYKYSMDESLFTSLKDIFEAIIGNPSRIGVVSPHKFLEILRRDNEMFRSAMHQDAHEFLNLLLNQVVDNVELFSKQHPDIIIPQAEGGAPQKGLAAAMSSAVAGAHPMSANGLDTHWVHDLFEGLLTSETRCLTCENTSQRDEAFLDLSVDLAAHTSVTSCLRKFSEEEMLCERNKFHCDNCGGLQEAEKRMKIKRLPRILALHLKRFKYTEDLQRLQKLFHRVVYPFHLRLFNTTEDAEDSDRLYELYAVVVHIGGGPYHGHYVSIIKTQDRGWLLFDDELVEPVDKSYVLNFFGGEPVPGLQDAKQLACAYVLFYQETTLEAVLKEQETEGGLHPVASRVSDAETFNGGFAAAGAKPDLRQTQTVTTPILERMEFMDPLVHAETAPDTGAAAPVRSPSVVQQTTTMSGKSKKEVKAEEKQRKIAEKERIKGEEMKRKEASARRVEAWKKQDEELKRVMEESKATAVEEMKKRGDEGTTAFSEKAGGGGALGRFRHGSMSLRGKPKLFGKDKEANGNGNGNGNGEKLTSIPQRQATVSGAHEGVAKERERNGDPTMEEKKVKNRFSLGRKKSQGLS